MDSSEPQTADQDPPEDKVGNDLTGDPARQQVFLFFKDVRTSAS